MGKFEVIEHPLVQHKLTMIRDKTLGLSFPRNGQGNFNADCLRGFQEHAAQRS